MMILTFTKKTKRLSSVRKIKKCKCQLHRTEIVTCPYFRLNSWKYKDNNVVFDMYCHLDQMIFYSFRSKNDTLSNKEKRLIRISMRQNCAIDCPKMWNPTDYSAFEREDSEFDDHFAPMDDYPHDDDIEDEREYLLHGWKKEIEEKKNLPAKIEPSDDDKGKN